MIFTETNKTNIGHYQSLFFFVFTSKLIFLELVSLIAQQNWEYKVIFLVHIYDDKPKYIRVWSQHPIQDGLAKARQASQK